MAKLIKIFTESVLEDKRETPIIKVTYEPVVKGANEEDVLIDLTIMSSEGVRKVTQHELEEFCINCLQMLGYTVRGMNNKYY